MAEATTTDTTAAAATGAADNAAATAAATTAAATSATATDAGKAASTDPTAKGTIAEGAVADDTGKAASTPTFPADWREQLAGKDEKFLATLKRYASPKTFAEGAWNLRRRMDAGEFRRPLGEAPTPEEIAAYRKENGIPEKPEEYKLPDGLQVGEIDKPIIDGFLQFAHGKNRSQAEVQETIDWYYKAQAQAKEQMDTADAERHVVNEDQLRAEWGRDFRPNLNAINNWLDANAPAGLKDKLLGGRLADGSILGDDPDVLRFLAQTARSANPLAHVAASTAGGSVATAEARLGELNALMGDQSSKYWKGPEAEKLQKEWRELHGALDTVKKRAA